MRPFTYDLPLTLPEANSRVSPDSAFIAGGTTLLDLMKL
jgi:CO/xanthine dehydrogenase FAD-binding subunit